jgi:hypothetical protein
MDIITTLGYIRWELRGSLTYVLCIINIPCYLPYSSESYKLSNDTSKPSFNAIFHE